MPSLPLVCLGSSYDRIATFEQSDMVKIKSKILIETLYRIEFEF